MFAHAPGVRVTVIDKRPGCFRFIDAEIIDAFDVSAFARTGGDAAGLGEEVIGISNPCATNTATAFEIHLASGKQVCVRQGRLYSIGRTGTIPLN